jgi:hypothetical protein
LAIEYDLYKENGDIDMCIDFEILKVKVPIRFLGTMGFSLRREGRYSSQLALLYLNKEPDTFHWPGAKSGPQ